MASYGVAGTSQTSPGARPRSGGSNAGKYIPEGYFAQGPPRTSVDGLLVPPAASSPYPTQSPSYPSQSPIYNGTPQPQYLGTPISGHTPYPVDGDHITGGSRRYSSGHRPNDPRRHSHSSVHSHRSSRSHKSTHSHHSHDHGGERHEYQHRHHHHHDDDYERRRSSSRSRSRDGRHGGRVRRHSDADVRPLKRVSTNRPTLGGTVMSMFNVIKDALGPRDKY